MKEPSPIVVFTDSWTVYRGLILWLPTWYHANWLVGHQPLWGQELWQGLWACGQTKIITVYHVIGHLPLTSPGNEEADKLAQICWLEGKPASDVAQWLYQCLLQVGQKTMWKQCLARAYSCFSPLLKTRQCPPNSLPPTKVCISQAENL